ncbi:MAG: AAA family ATPase [Opitutales bacterium]|nr:AAA family ATPase [Opitutales bacterium]
MRLTSPHVTTFVAITGGSGSGKSWLSQQLLKRFGDLAGRISLDDFYRDRSDLTENQRNYLNFDNPDAIEWSYFKQVLAECAKGQGVLVPRYDFVTHSRQSDTRSQVRSLIVIVDGLWLLHDPSVREHFQYSVYIECPDSLRMKRRLERDHDERGRSLSTVRKVFDEVVRPMHEKFVEPQIEFADVVLTQPISDADVGNLYDQILNLSVSRIQPGKTPDSSDPYRNLKYHNPRKH